MRKEIAQTIPFIITKTFFIIWLLSLFWVVKLSLKSGVELPGEFWNADKLYHGLGYAWLAFLPFFGFNKDKNIKITAVLLLVLGFALEYGQSFIPGRCFSLGDSLANSFGIIVGSLLGIKIQPLQVKLFKMIRSL